MAAIRHLPAATVLTAINDLPSAIKRDVQWGERRADFSNFRTRGTGDWHVGDDRTDVDILQGIER